MVEITRPTLIVDKEKCLQNIAKMAKKAKEYGLKFRPHFKTHQSAAIGAWFREFGVNAITVSSVHMGEYFSDNGWKDITIAFPLNILEMDRINKLAETANLNLSLENNRAAEVLAQNLKF